MAGLGVLAALTAISFMGYAVFLRTELLRSERYMLRQRALEIIGADGVPEKTRRSLASSMKTLLADEKTRRARNDKDRSGDGQHG